MVVVLEIFTIFLITTITLLVIGFFKKQFIFLMLSGILFLILATFVMTGLQYKTGSIISTINATDTSVTNIYTSWNDNIVKIPLSGLFLLFGIFIVTMSWMKILGKRLMIDLWGNDEEEQEE